MWIEYIHVIYIKITENLVLLLNDTVVKLILSMKTLVDKYACVYFGKLPSKIGNHVRNRSWQYALFLYLQMHCFFASIYGKWFPWEFTEGHTRSGRGNVHDWLTRYVPRPFFFAPTTSKLLLHGIGLWDLQI